MSASLLWILSTLIVFVSAALQGMTGFGFAVLAVPLLILLHDPVDAVSICMVLSTLAVILMWWRTRRETRLPVNGKLFCAALLGLPLGLVALNHLNLGVLRVGVGIVTLAIAAVSGLSLMQANGGEPAISEGFGLRHTLIAGFISGFLTGSLSMPGPPIVALLNRRGIDKASYRATLAAYFAMIYPIAMVVMIGGGAISSHSILDSLLYLPALVFGMLAGDFLHNTADYRFFAISSLVILAAAGLVCLTTGLHSVVAL